MLGEGATYATTNPPPSDCSSSAKLNHEYGGKLGRIHELSENRKELERRLAAFEGVGPKTVEIFMREAARVWY